MQNTKVRLNINKPRYSFEWWGCLLTIHDKLLNKALYFVYILQLTV